MDGKTGHGDDRRLAEIERELTATDPALAAALSTLSPVRRPVGPWMALAFFGTLLVLGGHLLGSSPVVLLGVAGALAGSVGMMTRSAPEGESRDPM
ncbi:MAG: DUF3040 domain-containing protein [Saccharothrix sp.]|nr:DUF3040 domain-containing protein [Saccharothrix sp.]